MGIIDLLSIGESLAPLWDFVSQSRYLTIGVVLLIISVVISALSNLLSIAKYITIIGGIGLLVVGGVEIFYPGLLPLVALGV